MKKALKVGPDGVVYTSNELEKAQTLNRPPKPFYLNGEILKVGSNERIYTPEDLRGLEGSGAAQPVTNRNDEVLKVGPEDLVYSSNELRRAKNQGRKPFPIDYDDLEKKYTLWEMVGKNGEVTSWVTREDHIDLTSENPNARRLETGLSHEQAERARESRFKSKKAKYNKQHF